MFIPLFLCFGFFIAIIYVDLVFDVSALPYRKSGANLPENVLNPIVTYYRYITRNPYLLMFCMLVATVSIIAQIRYQLVPAWVGYTSIFILGIVMVLAVVTVIPRAQRLASGKVDVEKQTALVHTMFPYHITFLVLVLALALLQFSAGSR